MSDDDRRRFQRLALTRPLDGWFGDWPVTLTDVSATGAQIESADEIPLEARALLRFFWRGEEIEVTAETVRAGGGRCGVRFVEQSARVVELIAASAIEVLRAQQANAAGTREENRVGDETLTAASSSAARPNAFITCTLRDGAWKQRASLLPDQPPDGFTVSAHEDPEQIEMLCRTYESGDTESRRLTRLLAELSVAASR